MISFTSENIIIDFTSTDTIGIQPFLTGSRLNYIFSKYLFYKYSEDINELYVKLIYDIKANKMTEILNDTQLSNVEKVQLFYQSIMSFLNSSEISIITSTKSPNKLLVVFTFSVNELTIGSLVENEIRTTRANDTIYNVKNIFTNELKVEVVDDFLYTINTIQHKTRTDSFQNVAAGGSSYAIPDLVVVETPLNDNSFYALMSTTDIKSIYNYNNDYIKTKRLYNGYVFKLNFNGSVRYLYLGPSVENYKLKPILITLFQTAESILPPQVFSFLQCSYIATDQSKTTYIYLSGSYNSTVVYASPNPFCRQDYKFAFQKLSADSVPSNMNYSTNQISTEPTTTNIPYAYGNLFSLFYFTTPISRTIFCENETLLNYLKATYANNSTTIPSSNITTFLQYYNSIKRNFNKNTNQQEFQDIKGSFVNNNIGATDTIEYIDIQGFDTTTNLPILLYVSKNVTISNFVQRVYKISRGGILPINNNDLIVPYVSGNFTYMLQLTVVNYMGNWWDYCALHRHIYSTSQNFDTRYKYTFAYPSGVNTYLDTIEQPVQTGNFSVYLYKENDTIVPIVSTTQTLPYKTLLAINESTNLTEIYQSLDEMFYVVSDNKKIADITHSSIYFNYISLISHKSYYLTQDYIGDIINSSIYKKSISKLYNKLKKEQLIELYKDSTITDYTFSTIDSIITLDNTATISALDFKNQILSSITYTSYDTDNTTICIKDEIMSILIGSDLSKIDIGDTTNYYLMSFQKLDNILKTLNKIMIFNKVIGCEWIGFYNLQSDENDNTFSDYFISILSELNDIILFLDFDDAKIKSLSINTLEFNASDNNPIVISKGILSDKTLYKFSKDQMSVILNLYKTFLHIYTIPDIDIAYSYCSISMDRKLAYNPSKNDIIILK